eukprot:6268016-Prorocentrum_lima.AAC.1
MWALVMTCLHKPLVHGKDAWSVFTACTGFLQAAVVVLLSGGEITQGAEAIQPLTDWLECTPCAWHD